MLVGFPTLHSATRTVGVRETCTHMQTSESGYLRKIRRALLVSSTCTYATMDYEHPTDAKRIWLQCSPRRPTDSISSLREISHFFLRSRGVLHDRLHTRLIPCLISHDCYILVNYSMCIAKNCYKAERCCLAFKLTFPGKFPKLKVAAQKYSPLRRAPRRSA